MTAIKSGYVVYYYDSHQDYLDGNRKTLHEPRSFGAKLSNGTLTQALNEIPQFEFTIAFSHTLYGDIQPLVGIVEVINLYDGEQEFLGRVLTITGELSSSAGIAKSFICEGLLAYLHDSAQVFGKFGSNIRLFFSYILEEHNRQVESYKKIYMGFCTVTTDSDTPNRYTSYDDSFNTIKTYLIERLGGYIRFRETRDGFYIDYLKSIGEYVDSPIQLAKNIKSAKHELNLDGLITRIVPVGADLEDAEERDSETGQYITRERVTIKNVNDNKVYLEDSELVKKFGVIQTTVDWTDISDPATLKARGQQYLDDQKALLASWEVETVELYLLDDRFSKYKVGNTHPINNPPLSGIEKLQITKKEIDILNPQSAKLTIGSSSQTLSAYQLQQQEAKKSMERVLANTNAKRKALEAQLEAAQKKLESVQTELATQITSLANQTSITVLQTSLSQYQTLLASEKANITTLKEQLATLEADSSSSSEAVALAQTQVTISQTRINNYTQIIAEIKAKITELGGS